MNQWAVLCKTGLSIIEGSQYCIPHIPCLMSKLTYITNFSCMKSWLDGLNLNLYREFILSLDQSLQSGWNHQLLCVNNGVHPSLCSPVMKETLYH